jgi:rhodanese-related sulfurtransferase
MTEEQSTVPMITCEELKKMMDEGADLVLVDTRLESGFQRDPHIPGAINIPDTTLPPMTEMTIEAKLMSLPWDQTVVFYCDCSDESGSIYLAEKLINTGFDAENVRVLAGGLIRWLELGYPTEK